MQIENCVAVVTGGASLLGAATAQRPAAKSARMAIFNVNSERKAAPEIGALFAAVNVTDGANVTSAVDAIEAKLGTIRMAPR